MNELFFIKTKIFNELQECLRYLFEKKYSRFSVIESQVQFSNKIFEFACKIFKRGILPGLSNEFCVPKIFYTKNVVDWKKYLKNLDNESIFIIVDNFFFTFNDTYFKNFLKRGNAFFLDANENKKNLLTVSEIIKFISKFEKALTHANPRNKSKITRIIAIGGGLTLDLAGFISSIFKTKLTLIPTTFLGMIDATLGGKTGINFEPFGKNQIGSFYFCDEIVIFFEFLKTLSHHQILSGLCEALKHSWLSGNFLNKKNIFESIFHNGLQNSEINLMNFISENLNTKLKIISKDPLEQTGYRKILNFGHTIGHVIETLCIRKNIPMPHGFAVAHGMNYMIENNFYKKTTEICEFDSFLKKIINLYPFDFSNYNNNEIEDLLHQDKKNKDQTICFIKPEYGYLLTEDKQ